MDTDNFTVYIKTEDIYVDIAEGIETRFALQITNYRNHYPKEKIKM